jgi:hypothetical protein
VNQSSLASERDLSSLIPFGQSVLCGPFVDQLRQDFWNVGACNCDTRKALDFLTLRVRDQEVDGSNPFAPTILHFFAR